MLKHLRDLANQTLSVKWIRKIYVLVNRVGLEALGSSRLLIHMYYFLNLFVFNREQASVLRGRRDYYRQKNQPKVSHVGLRRNIHRLEKSLVMRPRKPIFAKDYILETVEFYESMASADNNNEVKPDQAELQWSRDVLEEYFSSITGVDSKIETARKRFLEVKQNHSDATSPKLVPRPKQKLSGITYEEILALSQQRRSVRWFQEKPVPREILDKAMLVARQAPTACNRLPYEFRFFDDPKLVKQVISLPFGVAGFGQSVQTVVVVVGKLSNYFSARDRHAIYIDSSLAAMSFILALETLGLSSTIINWPDLEPLEIKMRDALGLDFSDRVVMLMAVGYEDLTAMVPYSQKKELDSIRSFNRIGN